MKLGFLTEKIADIAKARRLGFAAVELDAGAFGNPGLGALDPDRIAEAKRLCAENGVEITALAYYDLAGAAPAEDQIATAYERVFDAAEALGVQTIASMSGFDAGRDWEGN